MLGELKAGIASMAGVLMLVLGFALGILAGGIAVRAYDAWVVIPSAERAAADAATKAADARWNKLLDDAKAEAETARRNAEIEIADAERDYLARDAIRASQMTALEQALEQDQANVPIPSSADRSAPGVCGPSIRRGVRDALQGLGRAGPGPHPAKSGAAVRPGR